MVPLVPSVSAPRPPSHARLVWPARGGPLPSPREKAQLNRREGNARTADRSGHADLGVRAPVVAISRCQGASHPGGLHRAGRTLLPATQRANRPARSASVRPDPGEAPAPPAHGAAAATVGPAPAVTRSG